jgi:hypothetical protein
MLKRSVSILILLALAACAAPQQIQPPVPQQVALPPAPPPGEPAGIVGLEETQLRAAFGQPAFIRKDGRAEMWRYDSPGCRAFFFLYPAASNALAVRHVETLPRGADTAADNGCLAALRNKPATPVS